MRLAVPATNEATPAPSGLLAGLASLKFTLPILVMLGISVMIAYDRQGEGEATLPLILPLCLLAINLAAAVVTNRAFRRQFALLVFHLALLAIVILIALGRMTYLRGAAEVTSGAEFDGLLLRDAGPWHGDRIGEVKFVNLGFSIRYSPGRTREDTVNRVRWRDGNGLPHTSEIGDQTPLVLHGYRFYTTHNKGFAPVFTWSPRYGDTQRGSVHLPAFPAHEQMQEQRWLLPGTGTQVWVMLKTDEVLLDPARAGEFQPPGEHSMVVRLGDLRGELRPGEAMPLPGGTLRYEGMSTWMGYAVFHDWTMPWLLAACTLAVLALAWHFHAKYFSRPWNDPA